MASTASPSKSSGSGASLSVTRSPGSAKSSPSKSTVQSDPEANVAAAVNGTASGVGSPKKAKSSQPTTPSTPSNPSNANADVADSELGREDDDLNEDSDQNGPAFTFEVHVSMMEIYNEQVKDLLLLGSSASASSASASSASASSPALEVRLNQEGEVFVQGLTR